MPGVQVLPAVPSFGEKLAETLAQAGGNIGQGFIERQQRANDQQIMNQLASNPSATSMDMIKAYTSLSKPTQATIAPLMQQYIKGQQQFADTGQEEKKQTANQLNQLEEMIPYTGVTKIPFMKSSTWGGLARETLQKREQFTTQGFWITDKVYTHFNKGQISEKKLQQIKDNLAPRADLSERKNKGRIAALRAMASLPSDADAKIVNKVIDKGIAEVKKIPEAKIEKRKAQRRSLEDIGL